MLDGSRSDIPRQVVIEGVITYSRRYEGYNLKQKLIEKLVRDGFSYYTAKDYIEKQDL